MEGRKGGEGEEREVREGGVEGGKREGGEGQVSLNGSKGVSHSPTKLKYFPQSALNVIKS